MRNTLLITVAVAALAAGAGLASAQGVNERHDPPGAAAPAQKAPAGKVDQKPSAPNASHSVTPAPLAQTPDKAKPAPLAQTPDKAKPAPLAQTPDKAKPAPLAQAPDKAKPAPLAPAPERASDVKRDTTGQGTAAQSPPRDAQSTKPGHSVVPLSTEQHARLRETIRAEKVERLSNVQFTILVGDAVPRSIHLYRLPARIVDYAPQYQDYEYILVGDDILIVDPLTLRIVAVIAS
jgi:hypothetical protein